MKIFFIGTVEFSKKTLQKLVNMGSEIVGVATKSVSKFNADFADLTDICVKEGIDFKFIDDINSKETIEWIRSLKPDIVFCFGWSSLIKKELLNVSPKGVLGFHPASLPQNRGRHPLIWALFLGLQETASTFFFMDEGADSGDILSQKHISIKYDDDAGTLYKKVINTALEQIDSFVPKLRNNTYEKLKQDHSKANTWRKRGKHDGKIDFRMPSNVIYNLVRALAKPYVGAHVEYKGKEFKVWKVRELEYDKRNIEYGKIISTSGNTFKVKTCDGAVEITDHEFVEIPQIGSYI